MRKKAPIDVSYRACLEIEKLAKRRNARILPTLNAIGLSRTMYYAWKNGDYAPDVLSLLKMHYAGVDVMYILTGIREGGRA